MSIQLSVSGTNVQFVEPPSHGMITDRGYLAEDQGLHRFGGPGGEASISGKSQKGQKEPQNYHRDIGLKLSEKMHLKRHRITK